MKPLYEVHSRLGVLFDRLEAAEDEAQAAAIAAEIAAAELEWDDKLAGCCAWLKNLGAEAEMLKAEEKRLKERRERAESAAANFLNYLRAFAPQTNWKHGPHELTWKNTPGSVELTGPVPSAFQIETWSIDPDIKRINKHLREAGDQEWAKLKRERKLYVR